MVKNVIIGLMTVVLIVGSIVNTLAHNKQVRQNRKGLELLLAANDSVQILSTELGDVQLKYSLAVDNLSDSKNLTDEMKDRINALENALDIKVEAIEHLKAEMADLRITTVGEVTETEPGVGFIEISQDTMGIAIHGKVFWPSGETDLLVERDPLEFFITMQQTPDGLIAKTIDFPNQPWITVKTWDIVVLNEDIPKEKSWFSFMTDPLGALKSPRFLAGVSFGSAIGGDIGVSLNDLNLSVTISDRGTMYHITKSFSLW